MGYCPTFWIRQSLRIPFCRNKLLREHSTMTKKCRRIITMWKKVKVQTMSAEPKTFERRIKTFTHAFHHFQLCLLPRNRWAKNELSIPGLVTLRTTFWISRHGAICCRLTERKESYSFELQWRSCVQDFYALSPHLFPRFILCSTPSSSPTVWHCLSGSMQKIR